MPEKINITERLKSMKPRDFIYPGIFIVFLIIVGIVFYNTATFISQNINKVFSVQEGATVQGLNLESYKAVAHKLNIPVIVPEEPSEITPEETSVAEPSPVITEEEKPSLDKKSITLRVLNSTTKAGLAGALSKELSLAGFSTPTTGTLTKPIATTTIHIKESSSAYGPLLLETVRTKYPDVQISTIIEDTSYDAIITIGIR